MIRSHEHYEALKNLAVALNAHDISKYHSMPIAWLEAAKRLALSGSILLSADGEIIPAEHVQAAKIWPADLLFVFPSGKPVR
jgi:hypothetical protein